MSEENNPVVRRMPLWRSALDDLMAEGVDYGKVIPALWFEERLKTARESMEFGLAISAIRRELEKKGFYLSGRGQNGNQFLIVPPEGNADAMQHYSRLAVDALKRGVILGTHTRLDSLSAADRRRHESILEKLAIRSVLINRSASVAAALKKYSPKVLKGKEEDRAA
jgi:hypothetical protein